MQRNADKIWENANNRQLADVLTLIDDSSTMRQFLRDVMTGSEIIEIGSRFEAARMLKSGSRYTDIAQQTKLSSRTIARISDWIKQNNNGYSEAINKIDNHQKHILPAPTE